MSYGLGVVVGPYIGGYLSTHYSEQLASGVAGAGCIVAVAVIWIFVPKSTKRSSSVPTKKEAKDGKVKVEETSLNWEGLYPETTLQGTQ